MVTVCLCILLYAENKASIWKGNLATGQRIEALGRGGQSQEAPKEKKQKQKTLII